MRRHTTSRGARRVPEYKSNSSNLQGMLPFMRESLGILDAGTQLSLSLEIFLKPVRYQLIDMLLMLKQSVATAADDDELMRTAQFVKSHGHRDGLSERNTDVASAMDQQQRCTLG
jgi:hypothetical protein